MNTNNKYLKLLFNLLRILEMNLTKFLARHYHKLSRNGVLKLLFISTLVISLSLGQVVYAKNPSASDLVERGIKDYNRGDFRNAVKYWEKALEQYKKNPSARAVVNENLGRAYQELGEDKAAIESLSAAIRDYGTVKDIKQVGRMKTELAQLYSNLGQPRKAIAFLCGKIASKSKGNGNQKIEQVQCLKESAEQIATEYNDQRGKIAALGVLGDAYRLIGNYDQAIQYLKAAQKLAPKDDFLVLNSLGNVYRNRAQLSELQAISAQKLGIPKNENKFNQSSLEDYEKASQHFQDSIKFARQKNQTLAEMRGLLNLIQLASQAQNTTPVDDTTFKRAHEDALKLLEILPDSATKVYGAIDLAYLKPNSQRTSPFISCPTQLVLQEKSLSLSEPEESLNLLQKAVLTSNKLQDNRLQSFANGALGHFWECQPDNDNQKTLQKALTYTRNAIVAADSNLNAKDSLYLWEWQAGRIFNKLKKTDEAIDYYQRAYETLEDIRQDILTAKRDVQFNFRDVVRPLYRTLAQSRLERLEDEKISKQKRPEELSKVVKTIDALKLAELQNYFGNDCILSALNPKQVDELLEDKENSTAFENTAFLSSIILDGKTGILLQSPKQETKVRWIKDPNQKGSNQIVSTEKLEKKIKRYRQNLVRGIEEINYDQEAGSQLYDWIIRPFIDEGDISPERIKTLVFLQDGFLRSVPMAALYDSKQQKYLVENYAIGTTPSLRITTPQSRRNKQKALILGLTTEATIDGKAFDKLYSVDKEIQAVKKQFPNHTPLIDDNFLPNKFKENIKRTTYPIVHIASHAQFGIIPEDTFIVAGNNQKITISQLENTLQNLQSTTDSVELLALTACQTAVGDDRATLGLAGVALQVGVKSAIASLWNVQDASTSRLVEEFYQNYRQEGMSIAQALQKAQIKMINAEKLPSSENIDETYNNPGHWAPMIVIGNWL